MVPSTCLIPGEIADEIAHYLWEAYLLQKRVVECIPWQYQDLSYQEYALLHCFTDLLRLRSVCRSLRTAVDRLLFSKLKIDEISPRSCRRLYKLLQSPSICNSVRQYKFVPKVRHTTRPEVEYEGHPLHWDSFMAAKRYDEQLELMGLSSSALSRMWIGLKRFLLHAMPEPRTSELRTRPYFKGIDSLTYLEHLEIGYMIPLPRKDSAMHYLIKNDTSAGFGNLLATSFTHLKSLVITGATLTDLKNLVHFMHKALPEQDFSFNHVKSLGLHLAEETLLHRGRTHYRAYEPFGMSVSIHSSGGKTMDDFIQFFPQLEQLELTHSGAWDCALVLQNFRPAILKHIRQLRLEGLALRAVDLLRLTLGDADTPIVELVDISIWNMWLFRDDSSWSKVLYAWRYALPNLRKKPYRHPDYARMGYLDLVFSDMRVNDHLTLNEGSIVARATYEDQEAFHAVFGDG